MDKSLDELAQMRESYERAELTEALAHPLPLDQFRQWFEEAVQAGLREPNAMTLATVGAGGRPSTRVVLLKGVDERGLAWFTNYASRKGQELASHPFAALQFFWAGLERVVRIEGRVAKVDEAESDAYYRSRPTGSRIGAWASPQSEVIASREALQTLWTDERARLGDDPPRPAHWGGYRLVPDRWEFWQGRPSRLHDRLVYEAGDQGRWSLKRLAP